MNYLTPTSITVSYGEIKLLKKKPKLRVITVDGEFVEDIKNER